ncbi:MAG: hypothetical protein DCC75_08720, partial [Proteobacteria bacterium]
RLIDLSDRHKRLINSLPESMVMTLSDQSIVSVNDAACKLLQISETSCSARKLHEVLRQIDGRLQIEKLIGKDGAEVRGELELPSANGPLRIKFYGRPVSALLPGSQSGLVFVFQDITKLRSIEEQLELHERMARLLAQSSTQSQQTYDSGSGQIEVDDKGVMFVGESVVMKKVFGLIQKVAPSDATILIYGESGTGKELVARAIHHGSGRTGGPFVAVNCGAIPETLIESELFGHKKGSFTSAHSDNSGLFRQAHGGTIFLDEIGELPVHVQSKLLRSIQERSVRPVGGDRDVPVDVRIIAATNRNLRKEIEEHNFREDLYYRLNVISVNLPPLRERKEDLPVLVHTILKKLVSADVVPTVPPQTMQILINYNYPGNVRELENILERAFVLGGEVILPEQLPDFVREYDGSQVTPLSLRGETKLVIDEKLELPVNLDQILNNIERRYLEVALVNTSGAKKKAAELLGMNFRSFRYRLQKYGLSAED